MPRNGTKHNALNKAIINKYKEPKEEWLNEKCAEVERMNIIRQEWTSYLRRENYDNRKKWKTYLKNKRYNTFTTKEGNPQNVKIWKDLN